MRTNKKRCSKCKHWKNPELDFPVKTKFKNPWCYDCSNKFYGKPEVVNMSNWLGPIPPRPAV